MYKKLQDIKTNNIGVLTFDYHDTSGKSDVKRIKLGIGGSLSSKYITDSDKLKMVEDIICNIKHKEDIASSLLAQFTSGRIDATTFQKELNYTKLNDIERLVATTLNFYHIKF